MSAWFTILRIKKKRMEVMKTIHKSHCHHLERVVWAALHGVVHNGSENATYHKVPLLAQKSCNGVVS